MTTDEDDTETSGGALYATEVPGPLEPYTHRIWRCGGCGHEILVPRDQIETQIDHANRLFCRCREQGIRMTPVSGLDGRVRL